MRRLVRIYLALLSARWSELVQYRAAVFLWTLWSLAGPVIHLSVWQSIARARGDVAGYGVSEIASYFWVQSIVYHFTVAWQVYEWGYYIRTGALSTRLLKPVDPSHHIVAQNVSFKLINLIWLIPIWIGLYLYFRPQLPWGWERAAWFAVALALSAALNFLWVHFFAMLAFWTVRADAIFDLISTVSFLLGGGIAPVAFLPQGLSQVAGYLPFYYMIGYPIDVATGAAGTAAGLARLAASSPAVGAAVTALWCALFFAAYRLLWRLGIRRYGAVGA